MHERAKLNQQNNIRRKEINKDAVTGFYFNIELSWPSSFTFSLITLPILPVFMFKKRLQTSAIKAASVNNSRNIQEYIYKMAFGGIPQQ